MRLSIPAAVVLSALLGTCSAFAQTSSTGAIAGVARDTTGAVLPGVTVEASSPALIEKVRSAVTDERGNYKIVELRPGTYKVTFSLPGFSTFQREGLELSAGFTASANAEMKIGSLEETVTVSGASPVVDVQNVRTQSVLTRAMQDSLPTYKSIPGFAAMTLGATVSSAWHDVGGNRGEPPSGLSIHGSRFNDSKLLFDGMPYNSLHWEGGGQMRSFVLNQTAVQETVLVTTGVLGESETGGVQMNNIPRDGSNRFSLYGNLNFANESMQGTNLSDEVRSRGLTAVAPIKKVYEYAVGVGGPVKRDRLWFYSANRWWGADSYVIGAYFDKSTDPFRYEPDLTRRAYSNNWNQDNAIRLTWQATAKNKITVSDNIQRTCVCFNSVSALRTPSATSDATYGPSHLIVSTWSHPRTNRLLLDVGASWGLFQSNHKPLAGSKPTDIQITEASTGVIWGSRAAAPTNGIQYGTQWSNPYVQKFNVSYVTGSHAIKTGVQTMYGRNSINGYVNEALSYTFLRGAPLSVTQWASPGGGTSKVRSLSAYAQDQWTIQRFTLSGAVRYDNYIGWIPEQTSPAGRFVQAQTFPRLENLPNFKDVTPRGGVAWDVFGDGKTAVKFAAGKYLGSEGAGIGTVNLGSVAIGASATRTWTDANGNFSPDCELTNFAANGECGILDNRTFGRPVITTRFDPDFLNGWGRRGNNLQMSATLQHELRQNVAVNFGYFRTSWRNQPTLVNAATTATDFTGYCVTAPSDSRLPNGGGYQVCGNYDVNPSRFGVLNNVVQRTEEFGTYKEGFNGVDVSLTARFGAGGFASGGVSTGRTVIDWCFQNNLPNIVANNWAGAHVGQDANPAVGPRTAGYCDITPPWSANTQGKANVIYPIVWGIQASVTYQNLPGIPVVANLVATNAMIAPSLGRNLSAGATATASINIVKPQSVFEDRINQLDMRLTKSFRVHGAKIQGMFDIYNLTNSSTILGINPTYGAAWLRPTSIMGPRLVKFGAQIDW